MKEKGKKVELIISPEAEEELSVSKEFYEEQKEGLGSEFVYEVDITLESIVLNPLQFPKVKKTQLKKSIVN